MSYKNHWKCEFTFYIYISVIIKKINIIILLFTFTKIEDDIKNQDNIYR